MGALILDFEGEVRVEGGVLPGPRRGAGERAGAFGVAARGCGEVLTKRARPRRRIDGMMRHDDPAAPGISATVISKKVDTVSVRRERVRCPQLATVLFGADVAVVVHASLRREHGLGDGADAERREVGP